MTTRLAVLLDGAHMADVERTRSGVLRLTYHDDLAPGATPLSLALPPQRGRFTGEAVETWLWGLLPESEAARSALRRTADELGVDESAVLDRVHRMTADAPAVFAAALDDVEDWDGSVTDVRTRLLPALEYRQA